MSTHPKSANDPARQELAAPDLPIEDHLRQVKRRLLGVPKDQLADEGRTYEKRKAMIEARKRRD